MVVAALLYLHAYVACVACGEQDTHTHTHTESVSHMSVHHANAFGAPPQLGCVIVIVLAFAALSLSLCVRVCVCVDWVFAFGMIILRF